MTDQGAIRSNHSRFHSLEGKSVSRLETVPLNVSFCYDFQIFLKNLLRVCSRLAVLAVVKECSDRNLRGKLWDTASMIAVVMRQQDEIDFVELRIFCGGNDAVGVAAVEAW